MRKYARQDANHGAIRLRFESLGCSICDLSPLGNGCPDLLVGFGGLCIAVEVKDGAKPPSKRKLTKDEEAFRMNWKGGYKIVEDLSGVDETVEVLKGWHRAIRMDTGTAIETGVQAECKYSGVKAEQTPIDCYDRVDNDYERKGD